MSMLPPMYRVEDAMRDVGLAAASISKDYVYLEVNDTYAKFVGKRKEDIEGKSCFDVLPGFDKSTLYYPMKRILEDGVDLQTGLFFSEFFQKHLLGTGYKTPQGVLAMFKVATPQEISFYRERDKDAKDDYDHLTLLPDRKSLYRKCSKMIEDARCFSLIFFDIDRFKFINDTYGHANGDRALAAIAQKWSMSREVDQTLYRLAGDEFVLLMEGSYPLNVCELTARGMIETIRKPLVIPGQNITCFVGASAGVAQYPEHANDYETLLQRADMAMYKAKKEDLGVQLFHLKMIEDAQSKAVLEIDVEQCIKKDELCLFYQPKVTIDGDAICGAEALLRWKHPDRGLVPPGVFLPAMESLKMMPAVDIWVLRQAVKEIRHSMDKGIQVPVSINISSHTLQNPTFVQSVWESLAEYNVPSHLLEIEITEGGLMRDVHASQEVLHSISDMGVVTSVDDFGTGYSSLAYLITFPIKTLKIDRSFVQQIVDDAMGKSVVQGLIRLAGAMKMNTVAEGVETVLQRQTLRAMGCLSYQGYLFSKPVPYDAFLGMCIQRGVDVQ